jgi:polysaccharide biosynthesis protein PslG
LPAPAASPFIVESGFRVGVNIHIGPNFNREDLYWPRFTELNATTFRMNMNWSWIEQQKGVFAVNTTTNWTSGTLLYPDSMAQVAHTIGKSPLIVLGFGNKFYDNGGFPVSDVAQAAFVNYATFVAKRYKGSVKYYELWNEWNVGGGVYPAVHGDPVVYARLLKKVYAALKAVDPTIVVIGGAASGQGTLWPQQMLAAGGAAAMDGYSVHPYNLPDVPEQALEYLQNLEATLKTAAGGREIPLYVTELGWATGTDTAALAPSTQADYLARLYLAAPMYSYLKAVWWYDLTDDGADVANVHQNFGLYNNAFVQKPAGCTMGDVSRLIAANRPVSLSRDSRGVWIAKYTNGTSYVYAAWTQDRNATVNATVTGAAAINARGICRTASVTGNGSTSLRTTISNSPTIFATTAGTIAVQ